MSYQSKCADSGFSCKIEKKGFGAWDESIKTAKSERKNQLTEKGS
jgi:hypothetical protein